jgi:hypothetical protein
MMKTLAAALLLALVTTSAQAKDKLPSVSADGLHLVPDTKLAAVYKKPGADLSQYDKVALLDTYVAFRKHWQRDHNREVPFSERVDDRDMERIKKRAAQEFAAVFTKVLSEEGGHQIVSEGGTGVLILRPALMNLEVTAPDILTAGISHPVLTSSGSVTLYMELYDGKTGDIIGRVLDSRSADNLGIPRVANSVTNKANFDRVLRRWAEILNENLAQVKNKK